MRRVLVVVLIVAATLCAAGRAEAHICSTGVQIPVGQPASVALVITVEATPIGDVEIDLPARLQVVGAVVPPDGWTVTKRGQTLRYRGGPFSPLTCPSFTITAQAAEKGAYSVQYVQRDANGNVVARTGPSTSSLPSIAPVVYAGVEPPSAASGSGPSLVVVAGIALIAIALLLFGGMAVRSWRLARVEARDDELDDRVAAFKKQAQDRKEERSPR
jgi:hypothetical protein